MNNIISFAGIDPTAGAGLLLDSRVAGEFNCHCSAAVTSITIQNSLEFTENFSLTPARVKAQFEIILNEFTVKTAKIGMTGTVTNLKTICRLLNLHHFDNIVWDPVLKSTTGGKLLAKPEIEDFQQILPQVTLLTPNLDETEFFCKKRPKNMEEMKEAAKLIQNMGVDNVLIKGGHLEGNLIMDYLLTPEYDKVFKKEKVPRNYRGTGCWLSTAIASLLASGKNMATAVKLAQVKLQKKMKNKNLPLKKGFLLEI
ncbi:MAG: bifunctional hydroxymethylpyrimidine kinase/phosphomethylpyrimidine kinase [Myxococcota bacterium]